MKTENKNRIRDDELEKINRFATAALTAEQVYAFTVTLCDNDIDRDFEKFTVRSLKELAPLFIGKTVIADHSMKSADQRARIFDTWVEPQKGKTTVDGEPLTALKARAYMLKNEENAAWIDAIEAGIKKEGSVSCLMRKRICSVCGKNKAEGRCEHTPSESYRGKLCYTLLEDAADAYEFSFVAVPAQKNAGVTKAYQLKQESTMEEIINTVKHCNEHGVTLNKQQASQLGEYLECLEDRARLGDAYKKELAHTVISMLRAKLPDMESGLIQSVVSVMTADELLGFKKGLEQHSVPQPQLSGKAELPKDNYTQFKI